MDTSPPPLKKTKKVKKPATRGKMITGYIIYASEIRKDIIKQNPKKDFGEISKIVGVEWKKLAQETKETYEKRAQEQNSLCKIQFMAAAAAAASAVTTTTTTTTTTVNVVAAANGSHSVSDAASLVNGDDSLEKITSENERQLSQQHQLQQHQHQQQQQQQQQQQHQQQLMLQQQQHHYNQQQAAYYSQLMDQATPILIRPANYQGAPQSNPPSLANDSLLDQHSQHSQHSQQSQSPAISSPPQQQQLLHHQQQQQQQQQSQAYHQIFSHPQSQQMTPGQQQPSAQIPYQLFQYPQQPTMVQYCNDPACCASGRYQPYPFSPPASATTPSSVQQQQHQQQLAQSPHNPSPPLIEPYSMYRRNNIVYRKPSLVRLRPKDAATQTDPVPWADSGENQSPKKELRFSEKFIQHISALGGGSPCKIATDVADSH